MILTEEQAVIQDSAREGGRSMRIKAFAGAGKTTTLKAIASVRKERGLLLAFNKSIADEANASFASTRVTARTMHAAVWRAMREQIVETIPGKTRCVLDAGVMPRDMMAGVAGWNRFRLAAAAAQSVARFCASADEELAADHVVETLKEVEGDPSWMPPGRARDRAERAIEMLPEKIVPVANAFMSESVGNGKFSHDMYLKCADLVPEVARDAFRGFKYLLVDEAQDLNPVQRSILEKSGLPLIAVGDGYQQIYSWRGSENALEHLPGDTFYLTGSFRFGQEIADTGMKILDARPDGGPSQRLQGLGGRPPAGEWAGPRMGIVCRTNAGVIEAAELAMGRPGKFCVDNFTHVRQELESLHALWKDDREKIVSPRVQRFHNWSEAWSEAEYGGDPELTRFVKLVENDGLKRVQEIDRCREADESSADVKICTGHRSKGLEWPAVKMWGDFKDLETLEQDYYKACDMSPQHAQRALEEWNLTYVAATRAMLKLGLPPGLDEELSISSAPAERAAQECAP